MNKDYDSLSSKRVHPYDVASLWSRITFSWVNSILVYGKNEVYEQEDLPPVSVVDDVYRLSKLVDAALIEERKRENPRTWKAIVRAFFPEVGLVGVILLISSGVHIFQAVALGELIGYLFDESDSALGNDGANQGWILAAMITSCGIAYTFLHHYFFFLAWRLGMQLKMVVTATIYSKSVRLSLKELARTQIGKIVNMVSHEVDVLQGAGCFIHYTYAAILESFAICAVGIIELGPAFLSGWLLVMLLVPLQGYFSSKIAAARRQTNKYTDVRLKYVNQALVGARLMKINGWEWKLSELIEEARAKEIEALLITNNLRALNEGIFFSTPIVVSFVTFSCYVKVSVVSINLFFSEHFVVLLCIPQFVFIFI